MNAIGETLGVQTDERRLRVQLFGTFRRVFRPISVAAAECRYICFRSARHFWLGVRVEVVGDCFGIIESCCFHVSPSGVCSFFWWMDETVGQNMNKEYKRYSGITANDERFYHALDEESMTWAQQGEHNYLLDFDLSSLDESQSIEFLQIFCQRNYIDYVPPYLRKLNHLKYLAIPSTVAQNLTSEDVPAGLEALYVYGSSFSFREQLHLENLVVLHTMGLGVGFRYENFPKLQSVALVGNKLKTLNELSKFSGLSHASLLKPHKDTLHTLSNGTMQELALVGGSISDLSGLDLLKDLGELTLVNMRKLTSLSDLASSGVREVVLEECRHVEDLAPLAMMANLRKVTTDDSRIHSLDFKEGVEIRYVGR